MFYVADAKIYLANFDTVHKIYPEVHLVKNSSGKIILEILGTGVPMKPRRREICSLEEIIAKFGAGAPNIQPAQPKRAGK